MYSTKEVRMRLVAILLAILIITSCVVRINKPRVKPADCASKLADLLSAAQEARESQELRFDSLQIELRQKSPTKETLTLFLEWDEKAWRAYQQLEAGRFNFALARVRDRRYPRPIPSCTRADAEAQASLQNYFRILEWQLEPLSNAWRQVYGFDLPDEIRQRHMPPKNPAKGWLVPEWLVR